MEEKKPKLEIKNIGKNLKEFRRLAGLKSEEVAELAHISHTYYKRLEAKNNGAPSLETLMQICMALNIPVDYVLKDSGCGEFSKFASLEMMKEIANFEGAESNLYSKIIETCYKHMRELKSEME